MSDSVEDQSPGFGIPIKRNQRLIAKIQYGKASQGTSLIKSASNKHLRSVFTSRKLNIWTKSITSFQFRIVFSDGSLTPFERP